MAGRSGRSSPQPAAQTRKGKNGPGRKPAKPTVLGRIVARPGMVVAGAAFAAVMTGIVANALLLQKGHHPSPLFSAPAVATALPSPPAVPVPPPAPRQIAMQPAAPVAAEAAADTAPTDAAPLPAPVSAPAAVPSRPAKKSAAHTAPSHVASAHRSLATHPDLIGQLLGRQDAKVR